MGCMFKSIGNVIFLHFITHVILLSLPYNIFIETKLLMFNLIHLDAYNLSNFQSPTIEHKTLGNGIHILLFATCIHKMGPCLYNVVLQ